MKRKHLLISGLCLALICIVTYFYLFNNLETYKVDTNTLKEIQQSDDNDIIIGDHDAPQKMIMYFDYNCVYCNRFFTEVYPELFSTYIDEGRVNLTLRLVAPSNDFKAKKAYQTVICINKYGNFEKLHKLLLHKPEIMYTKHFEDLIDDYVSMNESVAECILNSDYSTIIKNNYQFQSLKTNGTPTFVIENKIKKGLIDYTTISRILVNH